MLTSKIFFQEFRGRGKKVIASFTEHPYYKSQYIPGSRYSTSHNKAAATQERLGSWHGPWGEMLPWKDPLLLDLGLQTPSSPLGYWQFSWCWDGASLPSPLSDHNSLGYLIKQKDWVKFVPHVRKECLFGNSFSAQLLKPHAGCNGTTPYPRYLKQFNFLFQQQIKHFIVPLVKVCEF